MAGGPPESPLGAPAADPLPGLSDAGLAPSGLAPSGLATSGLAPSGLAATDPGPATAPYGWARRTFQGRALAIFVLAIALVRVLALRAMNAKTGLRLFRENYDADRLPPVDADEREAMTAFSRCFACGRCDVGESARIRASGGAYPGLMQVVLASSRSMPDHDAAARALSFVPDDVLREKEAICPAGVPFLRLARFVRRNAAVRLPVVG